MTAEDAEAAIANFCRHTDDVLFSSSPVDYREPTHVNVRRPEYWAEQFARHGFHRDVDFDASFVTSWATRFRRRREPMHRLVRDYERRYSELLIAANEARSYAMQTQSELARARADQAEAQQALAQARDRLFHMERSLFWKARGVWVAMRGLFGR